MAAPRVRAVAAAARQPRKLDKMGRIVSCSRAASRTRDVDHQSESKLYQRIDGELIVSPPPANERRRVVRKLCTTLWTIVVKVRLGEVLHLSTSLRNGSLSIPHHLHLVHKNTVYEASGVRKYWFVGPKEKNP